MKLTTRTVEVALPQSGGRPLIFVGQMVATASSYASEGELSLRWHCVQVYRTAGGQWILHVHYHCSWPSEPGHSRAWVLTTPYQLTEVLMSHDPLRHFIGYPADERFRAKQERVRFSLAEGWAALVSRILCSHPAFRERIA